MFSKPIKATDKKKTTLNWWEYYIGHCWMTGWQSIGMAFRNWRDLMTDNFEGYALLKTDDPYKECYDWFWTVLGEDEVYPKFFLEELMQMVDDIETGKVKTVPFTRDLFDDIDDLVGDLIDDLKLDEDLEDEV
jgi:hypothetical protein